MTFSQDGKLVEDKKGFLPYGVGERVCPGVELANMEMFLILTNILATFRYYFECHL